jgi:hypothetical protein
MQTQLKMPPVLELAPLLPVRPGGCYSPVFASHSFRLKILPALRQHARVQNHWRTRFADLE